MKNKETAESVIMGATTTTGAILFLLYYLTKETVTFFSSSPSFIFTGPAWQLGLLLGLSSIGIGYLLLKSFHLISKTWNKGNTD